jgi:hypothetical protein
MIPDTLKNNEDRIHTLDGYWQKVVFGGRNNRETFRCVPVEETEANGVT